TGYPAQLRGGRHGFCCSPPPPIALYPDPVRLSISQVAAVAFVLGMAVQVAGADQQPMEQELQVLNPTEEQQIEGGAVGAEQEVTGLDGGAAQEVGAAGVRTAAQKRTSTAAKFGVAVVGGAVALGTTVAMLLFL